MSAGAQVVCNKLTGSYYDSSDNMVEFTGVWDGTSCNKCDWQNTGNCVTPASCEMLKPQSNDEGMAIWLGGSNTCNLCSMLDPSGCNSTETCESSDVYNSDPKVIKIHTQKLL